MSLQNCSYSLTAGGEESVTRLVTDVPASGTVPNGQYDYFMISLPSATPITFYLTVLAGDPDAFIHTDPVNLPNNTYYKVLSHGVALRTLACAKCCIWLPSQLLRVLTLPDI